MNIGAIIVGVFAVVWTAAGARTLGLRWMVALTLLAILISVGIARLAAYYPPAYPFRFNGPAYAVAVAFEVVAIVVVVSVLRRRRLYELILPVISIIVGLHFFGMVPALGSNEYWFVGAAMCLWPLVVIWRAPRQWWIAMTGFGTAVILWISILCSIAF